MPLGSREQLAGVSARDHTVLGDSWEERLPLSPRGERSARCPGQGLKPSVTICFQPGFPTRDTASPELCPSAPPKGSRMPVLVPAWT